MTLRTTALGAIIGTEIDLASARRHATVAGRRPYLAAPNIIITLCFIFFSMLMVDSVEDSAVTKSVAVKERRLEDIQIQCSTLISELEYVARIGSVVHH